MPGLLFAQDIRINDKIILHIPTVGEVYDNEEEYYAAVSVIVATPYDMMVQLDDAHIDFTQINDFQLFLMLFEQLKQMDTSLLFGDLDLRGFEIVQNRDSGEFLLYDTQTGAQIDRAIHGLICKHLRKLLNITRNDKRPGNDEARRYMLERARLKLRRQSKKKPESQLEKYIVALVNTEQFPYNYVSVRDLTIYQFYASLNQIAHKIQFDNLMIGYYAGTVKGDSLGANEKSWIKL